MRLVLWPLKRTMLSHGSPLLRTPAWGRGRAREGEGE